ncbi:hypothetical protein [Sphingomonas panacisoli]|uniref:hypothetical protein n=1 Tax=Sphingomonas panacisoli TaxID=1813879 RepID=UPI0016454842|nr:hypothetical protein [Sphingomonas panacisoli]
MSDFGPADRIALDRATVPAMRAGLARDIVAAASAGIAPPRRSARGGWRRHGRVLLGAGALVIASATAAATGLLDKLPIRIPGITHIAEPAPKPKHVVRTEKPRAAPGKVVSLADITPAPVPLIDPTPTPQELWRERRAARIAAGLPVQRTLVQRAIAAKLRGLPPDQRQAAIAEWRRVKALPPVERKIAVAKIKADFLASHPRMAQRYEQRLEARAAAAADGRKPPAALPLAQPQPQAASRPPSPQEPGLDPAQRAARRDAMRQWRMERRAWRLQRREGITTPLR